MEQKGNAPQSDLQLTSDQQRNAIAFNRLIEVMDTLRQRCPWDSTQTWDSLRANTLEEVYELLDAIEHHDLDEVRKELGDVLLHVVFYSTFAREEGAFDIADVCNAIADKLIYRHPHIYSNDEEADSELTWEQLKQKEKGGNKTVLGSVPAALPSLIKAYRIQDKARNVGFAAMCKEDLKNKIEKNLKSIDCCDSEPQKEDLFGTLIFDFINLARLYKVNPEVALEKQNLNFIKKFNILEKTAKEQNKDLKKMSQNEKMKIWEQK